MTNPNELNETSMLSLLDEITVQELGGSEGGVVLNLRSGEMYTVNDTAVSFLKSLDGQLTILEVAEKIEGDFDVDRQILIADLIELGQELQSHGLISTR